MKKILATGFILSTLAFSGINAQEVKTKSAPKTQHKVKATEKGNMKTKMFNEIDADKDGLISKKEHKKFMETRFEELDKNKDSVLAKDEFIIKNNNKNKNVKSAECPFRGGKAFESLDKNTDGKITKKEFAKTKEEHFKEMDANKDGKISLEEFSSFKVKEIKKESLKTKK